MKPNTPSCFRSDGIWQMVVMAAEVQQVFDSRLNANDTTETHEIHTEECCKSCEKDEETQRSWILERNWGFTLEELFGIALKFFKGKLHCYNIETNIK